MNLLENNECHHVILSSQANELIGCTGCHLHLNRALESSFNCNKRRMLVADAQHAAQQ